jgi:hypothetical protein
MLVLAVVLPPAFAVFDWATANRDAAVGIGILLLLVFLCIAHPVILFMAGLLV